MKFQLDPTITKLGHSVTVHDRIDVQTVGNSNEILRIKNGNI